MLTKIRSFFHSKYAILLLALAPSAAFADSGTTLDSVLQNFLTYLTGVPARILATLAIVAVGFYTFHEGKIPKGKGIAVIVGIGIVFGAATIFKIATTGS